MDFIGDGIVHRVAYTVARSIAWTPAGRRAADDCAALPAAGKGAGARLTVPPPDAGNRDQHPRLHDQKDGNAGRDRDADRPARPQDPRVHRRRVPAPEMDTEEQQARPLVGAGTERGDITDPLAG